MTRSSKKVFDRTYQTKQRRDYVDYSYLDKLSDEEKKWLAKFTDEYYGASFKINTTFVEKDELIPHLKKIIATEKNPKKKTKLENQLSHYSAQNRKYLQISNHEDKKLNIDLRKVRSIERYYKTPSGRLSTDTKYKYDNSNIQIDYLQDCNSRANDMAVDIYSTYSRNELDLDNDSDIDQSIRQFSGDELSVEERMIEEEREYELERILDGLE